MSRRRLTPAGDWTGRLVPFRRIPDETIVAVPSLVALGLLVWLEALPAQGDWDKLLPQRIGNKREGKQAVARAMRELKELGLVQYSTRDGEGTHVTHTLVLPTPAAGNPTGRKSAPKPPKATETRRPETRTLYSVEEVSKREEAPEVEHDGLPCPSCNGSRHNPYCLQCEGEGVVEAYG